MKKYPCFYKKLNKYRLEMSGLRANQANVNQLNLRVGSFFSGQIMCAVK